jgi:hypothetical protein
MNKKNHQKKIIITIIILSILLINIPALSEKIIQANKNEEKIVTIKINKDINGYSATYLDITYSQTQRIIEKLRDLKIKLNQKQINDLTYINDFIKIFQEEKILPNEINLNSLLQIHNSIYTNISSLQLENPISKKENNYILNNDFPIHIGRNTIIASLGIGNYLVKRIIPIRPYRFINIIDKEILRRYNLTSTFSYAAACIWTPGPSGYHVLHSFKPIIGLENYSQKIFNDKSIGGIFLLGMNISLEAFSKDGSKVYFDATIGIYGADLMIGF